MVEKKVAEIPAYLLNSLLNGKILSDLSATKPRQNRWRRLSKSHMISIQKENLYSALFFIALIIISYFPIFHDLETSSIHMWDEATYANNSIDMAHGNNNIFIVQHLNEPDLYNSKPPFVIWMQALSIKALGINEFAIRLPSAIFSFLTVLLVYFFCVRNLQSKIIGIISCVILLSSKGYVSYHVVRSGDLDATLVFWLVLGLFTFIDLIINNPKNTYLHYSLLSISIIFGFLSKGIAGFFFIPFMFIISCFSYNRSLFKDLNLYFASILTFLICATYYLIRESLAPGYLEIVLGSEIFRFNNAVMSWHVRPFDYYYQNIKNIHFDAFFYILPISLVTPFIVKFNKRLISIYLLVVAIGYFLMISYPDIKLEYYDAPLYPILSVLISLGFIEIVLFFDKKAFNYSKQRSNLYCTHRFDRPIFIHLLQKCYREY